MRIVLGLLLVVGCHGDAVTKADAHRPLIDGGTSLTCEPSGGCAAGPTCSNECCGPGEKCVSGVCMCGSRPACGSGDTCEAAGPQGSDACGFTCCGASGPCPL